MPTILENLPDHGDIPATVADLQGYLDGIPLERISMTPPPGAATERHLVRWKTCELVEGVLIVKAYSMRKALLSGKLSYDLSRWNKDDRSGLVLPGAWYRLAESVVRTPDISYVRWERLGGRSLREIVIADFPPDLVVDFITEQNTAGEVRRKREECRRAGVKTIWSVDLIERGVWSSESVDDHRECRFSGLDAEVTTDTLPGFRLGVADLFDELTRFDRKAGE